MTMLGAQQSLATYCRACWQASQSKSEIAAQQDPQGYGEVVVRAFLTRVGGGQVDGEASAGEGQDGVLNGRADPRLARRRVTSLQSEQPQVFVG
jgi:hypothetical protein